MRRELHGLIAAFPALAIACAAPEESTGAERVVPPDGMWMIKMIDGKPAPTPGTFLLFAEGKIAAGYDGCNGWSIEEVGGKRSIVSDAMACPDMPGGSEQAALKATDPAAVSISYAEPAVLVQAGGHRFALERAPTD